MEIPIACIQIIAPFLLVCDSHNFVSEKDRFFGKTIETQRRVVLLPPSPPSPAWNLSALETTQGEW